MNLKRLKRDIVLCIKNHCQTKDAWPAKLLQFENTESFKIGSKALSRFLEGSTLNSLTLSFLNLLHLLHGRIL